MIWTLDHDLDMCSPKGFQRHFSRLSQTVINEHFLDPAAEDACTGVSVLLQLKGFYKPLRAVYLACNYCVDIFFK